MNFILHVNLESLQKRLFKKRTKRPFLAKSFRSSFYSTVLLKAPEFANQTKTVVTFSALFYALLLSACKSRLTILPPHVLHITMVNTTKKDLLYRANQNYLKVYGIFTLTEIIFWVGAVHVFELDTINIEPGSQTKTTWYYFSSDTN